MALQHVLATVPEWFHVTDVGATELLGSADIELDNAVGGIRADMRVRERDGAILVQEQVPGTRYPKTCHERHIQSDEHFCIGLNAGDGISSADHAVVWWGLLKHFLELQRVRLNSLVSR
ncbi:E2 domain-containing protein [Rhizobium sp. HT1-10]|uniref:E2 domain-containing protein n=1 Tax=Rhizobium sp. HT1-10 TaxID=3111638 RepID=UPI003C154C1D